MIGEVRAYTYHFHEMSYTVKLQPALYVTNTWHLQLNEQPYAEIACSFGPGPLVLLKRGQAHRRVYIQTHQLLFIDVIYGGQLYRLQRQQPPNIEQTAHASEQEYTRKTLTAPMAGTVVKVQVREGDSVEAHQVLMILSAMKMEHTITSLHAGTVQHIRYPEGSVVPGGAVLIDMA
jgi:3-methylcrotonyl-CoA carboxylase alpha subunit